MVRVWDSTLSFKIIQIEWNGLNPSESRFRNEVWAYLSNVPSGSSVSSRIDCSLNLNNRSGKTSMTSFNAWLKYTPTESADASGMVFLTHRRMCSSEMPFGLSLSIVMVNLIS